MTTELKDEVLRLLKEDVEFRYAVAGLIGLDEILKRLDRHEAELVRLREDMNKLREDMNKLREDMNKLREDMNQLREDTNHGFQLLERHLSALGARWGLLSEEAFKAGLRGLLEKEFKVKVERWDGYDEEGFVYGYPSRVEVDIALHDERPLLIEVASHVKVSDVYALKRKAILYEKKTGIKPSRLLIVTPYADDKAVEASKELEIEVYTKV